MTLHAPGITTVARLFFIAAWALATGILRIVAIIRLRKEITGEFWLALSGIASVVFAFLVVMNPAAGALTMRRRAGVEKQLDDQLVAMKRSVSCWLGRQKPKPNPKYFGHMNLHGCV